MKKNMLIQSLFSMPSAQATPSWRALITDSASSNWILTEAIEDLISVGSAISADILIEMLLHPTPAQDKYVTSDAVNGIALLYRNADPPLKQHISSLYAAHGISAEAMIPAPGRAGGN